MYHSVLEGPARGASDLVVSTALFEAQVQDLKSKGYASLLPRDLAAALDSGGRTRIPERAVVFTFDDALSSVQHQALPILKKAGYRAAVYVVSDQIGGHNAWDDGKGVPYEACMDVAGLRSLLEAGWEIGSHSASHTALVGLHSEKLKAEVVGSKNSLEGLLGVAVESFCYPYSAADSLVQQAVVEAGYTNACRVSAHTRSVTADRFALKRVYVKGSEGLSTFCRKVSPWNLAFRSFRKR